MITKMSRENGRKALQTVLKLEKNATVIEAAVYRRSEDSEYTTHILQVIGDLLNGSKPKEVLANIKEGKMGWKHVCYTNSCDNIREKYDFIVNPIEVEEGVVECRKCGGKRTFSYQKQCRGADEGFSLFVECVGCGSQWREN